MKVKVETFTRFDSASDCFLVLKKQDGAVVGNEDGVTVFETLVFAKRVLDQGLRSDPEFARQLMIQPTTVGELILYCLATGVGFNFLFDDGDIATCSAEQVLAGVFVLEDDTKHRASEVHPDTGLVM